MDRKFFCVLLSATLVCLAGTMNVANAATSVICPMSASDDDTGLAGLASAPHCIDGSNISDPMATGTAVPSQWAYATILQDDGADWATSTIFGGGGDPNIPTYKLTLALDKAYDLTGGHFWNFAGLNGTYGRSVWSVDVYASATGEADSYAKVGTITPGYTNEGKNVGDRDYGVDFALSASNVKYVQLTNWSNEGLSDIVTFNEIRFVGAAVPEPSAIALIVSGAFGLLAYAWRKRS